MNRELLRIYRRSSSVTFISGRRDSGKTDFAHLILEDGLNMGVFDKIASNVLTKEGETRIDYICYFDLLEDWLKTAGKKAYILDELGQHLYKMSFMSRISKKILKVVQLVRKFDAHLIGIAPSEELVNKLFMNTDLLDLHLKKLGRHVCLIENKVTGYSKFLYEIPRTELKFVTKDIGVFELESPTRHDKEVDAMPQAEKASWLYLKYHNFRTVGRILDMSHTAARNLVTKHATKNRILIGKLES